MKMKVKVFSACAVLASVLCTAGAQAANVYDGNGYITRVTADCQSATTGFAAGLPLTIVHRVATASGDQPDALVVETPAGDALLNATGSTGKLSGNGTFRSTVISKLLFASLSSSSGSTNIKTVPATVTATTAGFTSSGTITNLFGIPNCVLTFRAAFTLRP